MSFTSIHFAIFLPAMIAIYFLAPGRLKWGVMLLGSWYFYMSWQPIFLLLLLYSTAASFLSTIQIDTAKTNRTKRTWLIIGVVSTLLPLFFFKYFNFVNLGLGRALGMWADEPAGLFSYSFILPIGISFFTFQALSYVIDVYRGHAPRERHLGVYALYVSFFPQLVAGPIERATHLLPQMARLRTTPDDPQFAFDLARAGDGLRLVLWGLFKKLVIADNLAIVVDVVFADPEHYNGFQLLMATYFFAFQIYCDFSGYSDIARGVARIFGFDLMLNFNSPYISQSISEFWHRWHISLSTWFRDYVYRPLGGNRVSAAQWAINIAAVFVLSGLWHGANWTFVVWGALHGSYYLVGRITKGPRDKLSRILRLHWVSPVLRIWRVAFTFHIVVLAWVFFRAESISDAFLIVERMFIDIPPMVQYAVEHFRPTNLGFWFDTTRLEAAQFYLVWNPGIRWVLAAVILLEVVDGLARNRRVAGAFVAGPAWVRWAGYYAVFLAIAVLAPFDSQQFIYFQF